MMQFKMKEFNFLPSTSVVIIQAVILIRILHRLYYIANGHKHYLPSFSPRNELEHFIKKHGVASSYHTVLAYDKVPLTYRKLGKGKKIYLLANGVGTDFFMWLPMLQIMLLDCPHLFDEITLIVPNYRGLFERHDERYTKVYQTKQMNDQSIDKFFVNITIDNCVEDVMTIMNHLNITILDGLIGWSTGSQIGLVFAAKYSKHVSSLFLFNPSSGQTLHYALQPFIPWPLYIRKKLSTIAIILLQFLKTLIPTSLWYILKAFNDSIIFHIILFIAAFFMGGPPEQSVYFHEYMKDVFQYRGQAHGLLDLIMSLDAPLPLACDSIQQTPLVIVSATPDFLTGVYHSTMLASKLPQTKHVNFTMGTHFVLLEFPRYVAKEVLLFLNIQKNDKKLS
jgi:3-oxoadipate enol-lactonase